MVGKLDKGMCGTRDAPAAWQAELEKTVFEVGFRPVVSTPCLCCHPSRGIRVVGHVDDLMCVGFHGRSGLDIFLAKLKGMYELNFNVSWTTCWRGTGGKVSWTKILFEKRWFDLDRKR